MSTCLSCGGIIGRDCFNPEECMYITLQQAAGSEAARQEVEELRHILQQLKAEIAAIAERMSNRVWSDNSEMDFVNRLIKELRQLSAV